MNARCMAAVAVAFASGVVAMDAAAQAGAKFPTKTIRIIVPYPASGPTDLTARTIAPHMSQALGQSIIMDNRAGGSTIIGTELVARSPPDGHTLLMVTSTVSINPSVFKKLPYDTVRDLAPVTIVISTPFSLVTHPSVPVKTAGELVKLAKARPGQLNYPSSGIGSANHLAVALFSLVAGIDTVHVPYKGTAQGLTDLLAGHVQFAMNNPLGTLPHARQGKLKLLAMTGKKRLTVAPDVPTVAESGLPGYEAGNWHAMFAPGGTPRDTLVRLQSEVAAALAVPEVKAKFADGGAELGGMTPDEFATYLKGEIAKWGKAVKVAGVQPE